VSKRLPLVLSALALTVSVLGATPLGHAAANAVRGAVPLALYANNAGKLQGHTASTAPVGGQIPVLDATGALPVSTLKNAPGLNVAKVVFVPGPAGALPVGNTTQLKATCPAGAVVIAGGFDSQLINAGETKVTAEEPDEGTQSWVVNVYNEPVLDPKTGEVATHTGKARAYALCVKA
jgi:hypothetical protein